jgi:hypothetical protein
VPTFRIIYWGNSADSPKIFKMQKRAVRINTGSRKRDSFRDLFKNQKNIAPFTHNTYCHYCYLWYMTKAHNSLNMLGR